MFSGSVAPIDAAELQRFARVHTQPILQNYSWNLRDKLERTGLSVALLWVNFSDSNSTNVTEQALEAFRLLCERRRGSNSSIHVLCAVKDESYAYYQRDFGTHEPYPFPFVGVANKLGFGEGDRFGYPFKDPVNATVRAFFKRPKQAEKETSKWLGQVLSGRVPASHESDNLPGQPAWIRGEVQDVVWKTFQKEVNGSTADVLLELYDNQRKQAHVANATMKVLAATLKDYSLIKVARMEVSQNYVPPIFGRKKYSKETSYYWVPPSIATGEWTASPPVLYAGSATASSQSLLHFLKKQSLSRWSLKEALETASDIADEVMGQAKIEQREDDRADQEKQQMIQKMMTTLKKEKGLVDVGEMMGLKKAADALGADKDKDKDGGTKKSGKRRASSSKPAAPPGEPDPPSKKKRTSASEQAERDKLLEERRGKLRKEEQTRREQDRKDREKNKKRKEADKKRQEKKKTEEAEARARELKEAERKRKKREEERALLPTTPLFSWGQSKEQLRISVQVPRVKQDVLNISLSFDRVSVSARDARNRLYTLDFELREFVVSANSSWALRYSEENPLAPEPDGVTLLLQKGVAHRWDRLAQNRSQVKAFMKHDWVQDDGELEEEREDVDLPSGTNVKKVTGEGLAKLVAQHAMVVAALRFPWCDKCGEKDKEFLKSAKSSKDKDHLGSIVFAAVDVREEKYLARTHNVSCSDQCDLLIFKQDEPDEPYMVPGKRYAEEIQIDCYKHLLPVVSVVQDKDHFDRVTSAFDTAIVGFFKSGKSEDLWYPRFRAVARQLRGHALFGAIFGGMRPQDFGIEHEASRLLAPSGYGEIANVSNTSVVDESGDDDNDGRPLVLLFKPRESRHVEFEGDLTLDKLTRFSRVLSLPLLSTYDFESRQKYQELKVPLGMLWIDGESPEREENDWATAVARRLAMRFSGHLVFVTLNNTRDALLMRPMGLDPRRAPVFGIATSDEADTPKFGFDMKAKSPEERRAFWADGEQAFSRLEEFCGSFLDGTLETSHESAELPPSYRWYGPGAVHEVVWNNFRESVYRSEPDVLLELYSPFRPQHRTYITVLDLLAEALRNVSTVKVVRMDTANNYVLPEFGLSDKDKPSMPGGFMAGMGGGTEAKSSTYYFLRGRNGRGGARPRPRRFAGRGGKAELLPERLLRFVQREATQARGGVAGAEWDDTEALAAWTSREAVRRIRRLRALEKDYEKKMQDEWMQKEMEEFERYKRLGKFDNLNV